MDIFDAGPSVIIDLFQRGRAFAAAGVAFVFYLGWQLSNSQKREQKRTDQVITINNEAVRALTPIGQVIVDLKEAIVRLEGRIQHLEDKIDRG